MEDERFREMILSKVKDGSQQIGLSFKRRYEVSDVGDIIAHKIDLGIVPSHLLLKNVSSQYCSLPTEVKEIPFLSMLQDLKLFYCRNIRD